jgi:anaerobic selenocysteine-containing dehydrogenase
LSARRAISYCRLCEAGCGVLVDVDASGAPVRISPDRDHPVTRGFLCTKGHALAELVTDPARVRAPLRRSSGSPVGAFRPASWEDSLDDIAARIAAIVRSSGPDAVAVYQGNPTAFSWAAAVSTTALARVIGTGRLYTASSIDCAERFVVADLCYGHPLLVTIPDLSRTRLALLLGANPVVSTWAQLTSIPRWRDDVAALRRAGGAFVVVDPRRTETADLADEHLAIRPGADLDLLLALVRVILDEGRERQDFLERHTSGLGAARAAIAGYTVERAAERTGIEAATIARLARRFASEPASFAAGHSGITMNPRGSLAEWAILLLNAVCGRIDAPGGLLFHPGIVDLVSLGDLLLDRDAPPPDGVSPPTRKILDDLPCAGLAGAIERGSVRALLLVAGNPAVTFPDSSRVRRALERLDLLVAIDPYRNESSDRAHYLLPPPSMLEREDCVLLSSSFLATPYAQWTPAIVAPPEGVRDEWWISRELARRLRRLPSREPRAAARRRLRMVAARAFARLLLALGPRSTLAALLALRGSVSLPQLRRSPHGRLLEELRAGELLPRLRTHDRRIALAPPPILELLSRDDSLRPVSDPAYPFTLLSRRRRGGMNSWLNHLGCARGADATPTAEIHPDDAASLRIAEGSWMRIESRRGAFEATARRSRRVSRGVLSVSHSVATREPGRSRAAFNEVVDGDDVEPLTGLPRFNGTAVRVSAASPAQASLLEKSVYPAAPPWTAAGVHHDRRP